MEPSKLLYHHYRYQIISSVLIIFLHRILVPSHSVSPNKQGFSLKLIDPLSPISPFYRPNLTDTERADRILQSDRRRLRYLISLHSPGSSYVSKPTEIQPVLGSSDLYYMVTAGIGSGAGYENYYLHLDTGSSLTWIQCEPCGECFDQQPRLFNPQSSRSYQAVMASNLVFCRAPFYKPGQNGQCDFSVFYADDTSSNGTLSLEVFTFPASQGGYIQVPNIVFGCAHETDTDYPIGGPVGIFGMNIEPESFISQESSSAVTGKRFSYCLVEPGSSTPMTLRFGNDIDWPPVARIQETPILRYSNGFGLYYVNLTGMSIDKTGIYFPPGTFDRDPSGIRGFMIDSGAHYTYLPKTAYEIVCRLLALHFQALRLLPTRGKGFAHKFDLCFSLPQNADPANLLPGMTFQFDGADLPLFYEQVFYVDLPGRQFCLAMFPEETGLAPAVLGAYQQVNTQFEFDLSFGGTLRLATVDCTHAV